MSKTTGGLFLVLLALAAAQPLAAGVIVGLPSEGGNCFPFGCSGTHYQQMYAASQFSGPITITDITFYGGDSIATGTYTFSLSTSPLNVFTMSTSSFAANIGSDNALFFSGVLGGPVSGSFTVAGTPFAYNPANGDLLLDIVVSSSGEGGYFDAKNGGGSGIVSRYHDFGSGFSGYGLVTGFNAGSPSAIPEAATWWMAAAGLGLLALRRKKLLRV